MGDQDVEVLWTVCSNLETLLSSEPRSDFPESFRVNLKRAWEILRAEHKLAAEKLQGG